LKLEGGKKEGLGRSSVTDGPKRDGTLDAGPGRGTRKMTLCLWKDVPPKNGGGKTKLRTGKRLREEPGRGIRDACRRGTVGGGISTDGTGRVTY